MAQLNTVVLKIVEVFNKNTLDDFRVSNQQHWLPTHKYATIFVTIQLPEKRKQTMFYDTLFPIISIASCLLV
jgi:hypothetical protein